MAANGDDDERNEREDLEERRARARRHALLLGLVVAAIYVGYLLLGLVKGIFPG